MNRLTQLTRTNLVQRIHSSLIRSTTHTRPSFTVAASTSLRPTQTIRSQSTSTAVTSAPASDSSNTYPSLAVDPASLTTSSASKQPTQRHDSDGRSWHLFDARGQVVGRMASKIAALLCGKHKPNYDPTQDKGDFVVILNAKHIQFTGNKWSQKLYRYHTGYAGGLKEIPAERWREKHTDRILRHAIAGMIHKNKLKVPRLNRLKIYPGLVHPHAGQFPFDIISKVPHLKAQRDAELNELAQAKQFNIDAVNLTTSGKKQADSAAVVDSTIQGPDDGTMPQDPDIRKAIIKDREQRKGRPIVLL